jgi:2'-hydroxyisoflavone reductase
MTSRREFLAAGVVGGVVAIGGARAMGQVELSEQVVGEARAAERVVPMKLLILGGTGFLGPDIVRAATERGHTLTLFNRGKTHPGLFPGVEKLQGDRDPTKDEGLKALEGGRTWDAVIDTSGYVPRIVRASAELLGKRVGKYIFVSSISVYEDPAVGADETAALAVAEDPKSEDVNKYYGALKAACEKAVEEVLPGRAIHVRPGLIVGPGDPTDRYTYWPVRMDRGGKVVCPGDGSDPVQYVDARDLGLWLVKMAEGGAAGAYNAVGPVEKLTVKQLLDACNTAAGGKAELVWVDAAALSKEHVHAWSDMPVWTGGVTGMSTANAKKAIAAGLTFRAPEETAKDTLAWWKSEPPRKLRAGLTAEREAALLASLGK